MQPFSRRFRLLIFMLVCLMVFSSCIFGRKGRKCNCPTWSYEVITSEEPAAQDAPCV